MIEEMNSILRFWLGRGVSGFRIDAVNHMFEVEDFREEPETGIEKDPLSYDFLHHYYTKDLVSEHERRLINACHSIDSFPFETYFILM